MLRGSLISNTVNQWTTDYFKQKLWLSLIIIFDTYFAASTIIKNQYRSSKRNLYDFGKIFAMIVGNLQIGIKRFSGIFFSNKKSRRDFFFAGIEKASTKNYKCSRKYSQSKIPEIFFAAEKWFGSTHSTSNETATKNDLKTHNNLRRIFFHFILRLFDFDDRHFSIHLCPSSSSHAVLF